MNPIAIEIDNHNRYNINPGFFPSIANRPPVENIAKITKAVYENPLRKSIKLAITANVVIHNPKRLSSLISGCHFISNTGIFATFLND